MSAAEKLNELCLEHKRLSHEGVISHNPERVMDALPQIVAMAEAVENASARIYGLDDESWTILNRSLADLESALENNG
jgi:hypothetical protein